MLATRHVLRIHTDGDSMSATTSPQVIRTERGLTISGTRITLYDVLGYLHAGWSNERARHLSADR